MRRAFGVFKAPRTAHFRSRKNSNFEQGTNVRQVINLVDHIEKVAIADMQSASVALLTSNYYLLDTIGNTLQMCATIRHWT